MIKSKTLMTKAVKKEVAIDDQYIKTSTTTRHPVMMIMGHPDNSTFQKVIPIMDPLPINGQIIMIIDNNDNDNDSEGGPKKIDDDDNDKKDANLEDDKEKPKPTHNATFCLLGTLSKDAGGGGTLKFQEPLAMVLFHIQRRIPVGNAAHCQTISLLTWPQSWNC
jgi:hypothetical protein